MSLARRALAELAGTALLTAAVVGCGIAAAPLSPTDVGVQLLESAIAAALALGALILTFGPVSGAHVNPVVSAVDWWIGRHRQTGLSLAELGAYVAAQTGGAILGVVGAYIGAAYWFTSSTSFANPAVTIGRAFTDTFAGIAPASVPAFLAAQLLGGVAAAATIRWWYPDADRAANAVTVTRLDTSEAT
jgi:glycerol uptake facilitator-like aquaporin